MTAHPSSAVQDDRFARELRGFGAVGVIAILVILLAGNFVFVPIGGLLVIAWARRTATPLADIGFIPPKSWPVTIASGIVAGALLKLFMKTILMPLLGADPVNHSAHHLVGNTAALPIAALTMIFAAGFGEETVWRGFFFNRFTRLFGDGVAAKAGIVFLSSALFGAAHYLGQGIDGVKQGFFTGLVLGTILAETRRIFLPMIMHAAFDLTALAIIYSGAEGRFAHLFFK